jgi:hypothetical protein
MNRKNLTAAVLAGLAGAAGIVGSAQAVNINPDGLGQVLIYPYYTTNGGNQTVLSVVNTSDDAKAVKVRFLEGQNSREVLDFNLYMSAFDVWTAAIYDDAGTPTMTTTDATCTVPYIYGNGGSQEFLPWAMNDLGLDLDEEQIYGDISRAAEGYIELIEMGTMIEGEYDNPDYDPEDPDSVEFLSYGSAAAATHEDGVPADCAQLVEAWTWADTTDSDTKGYWLVDPTVDIDAPSGGLFGGAAIVNPSDGTMYSYDAKAINGFADSAYGPSPLFDPLHNKPGDLTPNLNSGDVSTGIVFDQNGNTISSFGLTRGVDAVSFVFMHDQVMNEYTTENVAGADTEWVMTFPTKSFYVYEPTSGSDEPIAPFTSNWIAHNAGEGEDGDEDAYVELPCEVVGLDSIWDREERTIVEADIPGQEVPPIVSPAPPDLIVNPDAIIPFELCYEVSVIAFGDGTGSSTSVLGSSNFHNIDNTLLGFETGWARLQLDDYPWDADESGGIDEEELAFSRDELGGLQGLPVTGFAVQRFQNGFLGDGADVLANYGGIFQHKGTRKLGSLIN